MLGYKYVHLLLAWTKQRYFLNGLLLVSAALAEILVLYYVYSLLFLLQGEERSSWLSAGLEFLGGDSIAFAAVFGLVLILVKFGLILIVNKVVFRDLFASFSARSSSLANFYSRLSGHDFVRRSVDSMVADLTVEMSQTFISFVLPAVNLIVELVIVCFIVSFLLSVEPFGAFLASTVMGVTVLGLHLLTRPHIVRAGNLRIENEEGRLSLATDMLQSHQQVSLLGASDWACSKFNKKVDRLGSAWRTQLFLSAIPKGSFEVAAILSLLISAWYLSTVLLYTKVELFAFLGIFLAAAFRMIPSMNRIILGFQHMKFGLPAAQRICSGLLALNNSSDKYRADFVKAERVRITISSLNYRYEQMKEDVFKNDLDLDMQGPGIIGLVGPSGSGKTTLAKLIVGYFRPTTGTLKISLPNGIPSIGYVPQDVLLFDGTLRENIAFGGSFTEEELLEVVRLVELESWVLKSGKGLDVEVECGSHNLISGGQKQRIGLARALLRDPKILVLDEYSSALDLETENTLVEVVREISKNCLVVVVSHRPEPLKYCSHIFKFDSRGTVRS